MLRDAAVVDLVSMLILFHIFDNNITDDEIIMKHGTVLPKLYKIVLLLYFALVTLMLITIFVFTEYNRLI